MDKMRETVALPVEWVRGLLLGDRQHHNEIRELIDNQSTQPICQTCKGHGVVGGHVGQTPESFDYVTEDCPDCAQPAGDGCGACGDACASRGGCQLDDDSPQPAGEAVAWVSRACLEWLKDRAKHLDCPIQFQGRTLQLGDYNQPLYTAPPAQVPDAMEFTFRHPKHGEEITVELTREEIADRMGEELFSKLCATFCQCEPVGETNVVECNCGEYGDEFELVAAAPQPKGDAA